MRRKVYIAEIRGHHQNGILTGHYRAVNANYLELLKDDFHVIVAGGPLYSSLYEEGEYLRLPYHAPGTGLTDKLKIMVNCLKLFWCARGEVIILQASSVVTCFICMALAYWCTSKLYLIQYNTEALNSLSNRFIYALCKWKINGLIVPSDRIGKAYGRPYCVVPDYICPKLSAAPLPYEEREWDFCFVGVITPDKGIVEFVEKFAGSPYRIVVAGATRGQDLEERLQAAAQKSTNIELHLGFVETADYVRYLCKSRYCILNYRGTYFDRSSGVVLDALFNGTPVVGTRCTALEFIERNHAGLLYDNLESLPSDVLFCQEQYNCYLAGIENYMAQQKAYKEKLIQYLKEN